LNKKKMKKYTDNSELGRKKIFDKISNNSYKKTISSLKYIDAVKSLNNDLNDILKFYEQKKVKKISYDLYVNKKKAVDMIIKKICPKDNSIQLCKHKSKNDYIDDNLLNEINGKPIMLAIGKGNGSLTISNVKGSSMKGPLKQLIYELSKNV